MAGDEAVAQQPRKGGTGTTAAQAQAPAAPGEAQQAGLRCPRCDSPNTKFCYYNNYSLSQPRHFCKTCRRYWTKGGALRNVPVGGGCRKNKRSRSSSASSAAAASSRLSLNLPGPDHQHQQADLQQQQQQHAAVRMGGGFHGVVDFHPGSISMLPGPGGLQLHSSSPTSAVVSHGQYVPFGEWPAPPGDANNNNVSGHGMSGIASSIESLSYINQDLHWKLQQQRVATMFLGPPVASPHSHSHDAQAHHHHQFGAAGAFLQMETTTGAVPPAATSWFMQDSSSSPYPPPAPLPSSSSPCRPPVAAAAASCSNINSGRSSGGGGGDVDNATSNNSCGGSDIPSWGDISTFAMLP